MEATIARYKELAQAGQQFAQAAQVFNNIKPPQVPPTPATQPGGQPGAHPGQPPKNPEQTLGFWSKLKEYVGELQHAFHAAGGGARGFMEVMEMMAKNTSLRVVLGLAAIAGVAHKAIEKFSELEDAATKLDAALANQGKLTESYRAELQKLANEMQETTNVANDRWLAAFAKLTQFGADDTNINKYAEAVKNLAGFMGGDVEAAATIFGRAIEGNSYMLSRYGIHVDRTKTKTEQLEEIMRQLANRGGGVMEARTKTMSGAFTEFRLKVNDLWVGFGNMISRTHVVQTAMGVLSVGMAQLNKLFPETVKQVDGLSNKLGGELNKGLKDIGINIQKQLSDPLGKVQNLDTIHGRLTQILQDYKKITEEEGDQFESEKKIAEAIADREIAILKVQKLEALATAKTQEERDNIEADYDKQIEEREISKSGKSLEIERKMLEKKKEAVDELTKKVAEQDKQIKDLEEERAKRQEERKNLSPAESADLKKFIGVDTTELPSDQQGIDSIGSQVQRRLAVLQKKSERLHFELEHTTPGTNQEPINEMKKQISEVDHELVSLQHILKHLSEALTPVADAAGTKQLRDSFEFNKKGLDKAVREEATAREVYSQKAAAEEAHKAELRARRDQAERQAASKGFEDRFAHRDVELKALTNKLERGEARYGEIYGKGTTQPNEFIGAGGIEAGKQAIEIKRSFAKIQQLLAQYQVAIDPAEQDKARAGIIEEETKVRDAYNKAWKSLENDTAKQQQLRSTIAPALQAYLDIITGPKRNQQQLSQDFYRQGLNEPTDINKLIEKIVKISGADAGVLRRGLTTSPLNVPQYNATPIPVEVKNNTQSADAHVRAWQEKERLERGVRAPQRFGGTATDTQKAGIDRVDAETKRAQEYWRQRAKDADEAAKKLGTAAEKLSKAVSGAPGQQSATGVNTELATAVLGFGTETVSTVQSLTNQVDALTKQMARLNRQE